MNWVPGDVWTLTYLGKIINYGTLDACMKYADEHFKENNPISCHALWQITLRFNCPECKEEINLLLSSNYKLVFKCRCGANLKVINSPLKENK